MNAPLLSAAIVGLVAGVAVAQDAPVPPPPPMANEQPAPPPPGGPAPVGRQGPAAEFALGPQVGPGGRPGRPAPPPPPSRAAHFRLENGGTVLDVKCAEDEPMQACAQIAVQLLDRAAPGRAATP